MIRRRSGFNGWLLPLLLWSPTLLFSQGFTTISGVQYTTENGLPGSVVYDIIQDRDGFIWVGTETGLARFDGTDFVQYSILDGLPESDILAFFLDQEDRLWVHCLSSLAYFDQASNRFVDVDLPGIGEVVSVLADPEGNIWATGRRELVKMEKGNPDSLIYIKDSLLKNRPFLIGVDEQQRVLIKLTQNLTMAVSDRDTLIRVFESFDSRYWLHPFSAIVHPYEGALINSRSGIRRLSDGGSSLIPSLDAFPISIFQVEENGNLWAGGYLDGIRLFDYDPDSQSFRELLHLLPDQRINDILEDRDGNIWIATLGNGVFFFPSSIKDLEVWNPGILGQDPTIYSLHLADNGDLWMGGINSLMVLKQNGQSNRYLTPNNYRNYNRVLQILEPRPGTIQAVTDLGITQIHDDQVELFSNIASVKAMVYADSGYWVVGRNGLIFRRPDQMQTYRFPDISTLSIDSMIIRERTNVIEPSDSGLWLGGVSGIHHYRQGHVTTFPDDSGYFTPIITDIKADDAGRIWVSTNGGGMVCLRGNKATRYLVSSGLASLNCRKMVYHDGLLMIGTNSGLSIFDVSQADHSPVYLTTLTNIDGLPSSNIFDIILDQEKVILATSNGICRFPLNFIYQTVTRQGIYFGEIRADNELLPPVTFGQPFTLMQNSSALSLKFSTIDFTGSKNLEYRYKLEGIDEEWVYSRVNMARYTSLPFGEFSFSVQAKRTNNQTWPTEVTSISFVNPAPFWATWWFFFLVLMAGIGIFILVQQALLRRVENRNLQVLVNEQTQKLLSSNEELERSNQELKEFAYVVSHDLKSPLRTISSFAQLVQKRGKEQIPPKLVQYLDLIVEGSKKMNALIEDLLTYAQIGGKTETFQPVDLHFILKEVTRNLDQNIRKADATIHLSPLPKLIGVRHQLSLLFQNLLENAIKFRDEDPPVIKVGSEEKGDSLIVYVQDNGIGIPEVYQEEILKIFRRLNPEQFSGTGIGLSICQKIMALHEGKLEVQSKEGEGSTFLLHFPLSSKLTADSLEPYPFGT